MVKSIRDVELMLGNGKKIIQYPETEIKLSVRRSIVASHKIKKGKKLSINDISWIRPGGGLSPKETKNIIGKIAKKDLEAGQRILLDQLD